MRRSAKLIMVREHGFHVVSVKIVSLKRKEGLPALSNWLRELYCLGA